MAAAHGVRAGVRGGSGRPRRDRGHRRLRQAPRRARCHAERQGVAVLAGPHAGSPAHVGPAADRRARHPRDHPGRGGPSQGRGGLRSHTLVRVHRPWRHGARGERRPGEADRHDPRCRRPAHHGERPNAGRVAPRDRGRVVLPRCPGRRALRRVLQRRVRRRAPQTRSDEPRPTRRRAIRLGDPPLRRHRHAVRGAAPRPRPPRVQLPRPRWGGLAPRRPPRRPRHGPAVRRPNGHDLARHRDSHSRDHHRRRPPAADPGERGRPPGAGHRGGPTWSRAHRDPRPPVPPARGAGRGERRGRAPPPRARRAHRGPHDRRRGLVGQRRARGCGVQLRGAGHTAPHLGASGGAVHRLRVRQEPPRSDGRPRHQGPSPRRRRASGGPQGDDLDWRGAGRRGSRARAHLGAPLRPRHHRAGPRRQHARGDRDPRLRPRGHRSGRHGHLLRARQGGVGGDVNRESVHTITAAGSTPPAAAGVDPPPPATRAGTARATPAPCTQRS